MRLCVEDHGIGILLGHQEIIFRAFQRLNSDGWPGGTGIGLAIVQKAAERMGGHAGVVSQGLGCGSCFWVEFKRASELPNPCDPVREEPSVAAA